MPAPGKVTLSLPADVMESVHAFAPPRRQSQFIAEAIRYYVAEQQRKSLRERLIAGYQANAAADRATATEWSPLEDEMWDDDLAMYEDEEQKNGAPDPAG